MGARDGYDQDNLFSHPQRHYIALMQKVKFFPCFPSTAVATPVRTQLGEGPEQRMLGRSQRESATLKPQTPCSPRGTRGEILVVGHGRNHWRNHWCRWPHARCSQPLAAEKTSRRWRGRVNYPQRVGDVLLLSARVWGGGRESVCPGKGWLSATALKFVMDWIQSSRENSSGTVRRCRTCLMSKHGAANSREAFIRLQTWPQTGRTHCPQNVGAALTTRSIRILKGRSLWGSIHTLGGSNLAGEGNIRFATEGKKWWRMKNRDTCIVQLTALSILKARTYLGHYHNERVNPRCCDDKGRICAKMVWRSYPPYRAKNISLIWQPASSTAWIAQQNVVWPSLQRAVALLSNE